VNSPGRSRSLPPPRADGQHTCGIVASVRALLPSSPAAGARAAGTCSSCGGLGSNRLLIGRWQSQPPARLRAARGRHQVCIAAVLPAANPRRTKEICRNRRAKFDYELLDKFQCGIELQGTEVKSVRAGKVSLQESFARVLDGQVWLIGANIAVHERANQYDQHDPERRRRLLLNKKEILKLRQRQDEQGLTLVPTRIYFSGSWLKVEIALARGKKLCDKRESIKERESKRDLGRLSKLRF